MGTGDVKLCDCRGCGRVLLGESMWPHRAELPPWCDELCRPAARVDGAPYCGRCLLALRRMCCLGGCERGVPA